MKAIHLDCQNKSLYISWGGHTYQSSSNSRGIEISRKFGELLGLVEGQEVKYTEKQLLRLVIFNTKMIKTLAFRHLKLTPSIIYSPTWNNHA